MANILQFIIDIQSRQNGVVQQVQRVQNKLEDTDRSVQKLNGRLTGLKSALMSLPGAEFFTNPIVAMTAATGVVANVGMQAEKTAVSFEVLTGSQEKAARLMKDMEKYTPLYGLEGVNDVTSMMLGYGVAQDKILPGMKALANIAQGDTERLKGLALAFSQVAANGRLNAEDKNQMVDRGYNPLMDLSLMTGKSMAQLNEEMSKGLISFDMVLQAMTAATSEGGRLAGMYDKIMDTPFGKYKQMISEARNVLLNLYEVISPLLIPAFEAANVLLKATQPIIQGVADGIGWVRDNLNWLGPILITTGAAWAAYNGYMFVSTTILKGWTIAQWAQVTAMIAAEKAQKLLNLAMMMNPVGLIVAGITALVAVVVICWKKFAGFRAAVWSTLDIIKKFAILIKDFVIDRIKSILSGIGRLGSAIAKLFKGQFKEAWAEAKQGAKEIIGGEDIKKMAQGAVGIAQGSRQNYYSHLDRENGVKKFNRVANLPSPYDPSKPQWEALAPKWQPGISVPVAAAGTSGGKSSGSTPPTDSNGKGSEQAVTGGTRNTQITMNIGKFFDYLNVTMMDKADSREIQRIVLESINRSLEIATSAAR